MLVLLSICKDELFRTALMLAAEEGLTEIVRALLEAGADVRSAR